MFASASRALTVISEPAFRGVLLKSLLLTVALFALLLIAVTYGLGHLPPLPWRWLNAGIEVLGSLAIVGAMVLFGPAVAALFASLFLDEIAAAVEQADYPADRSARGTPFWVGLGAGARLTVLVIVATVLLLPLDIATPGLGELLSVLINGGLMGREFFELAALRHLSVGEAARLRRRHGMSIWAGGTFLALLSMVPVVNFFVPLYGAAFMVHLFQRFRPQPRLA